jgi:hypothetical protein
MLQLAVGALMMVTLSAQDSTARNVHDSINTLASDDDYATVAPDIVFPFRSFTVAVNCCVAPTASSVRLVGLTLIVVTTGMDVAGSVVPVASPHPLMTGTADMQRETMWFTT